MFPLMTDKCRSVKHMSLNIYGMGNYLSLRQLYPFSTQKNWLNMNHFSLVSLNAAFSSISFFPHRSSRDIVETSMPQPTLGSGTYMQRKKKNVFVSSAFLFSEHGSVTICERRVNDAVNRLRIGSDHRPQCCLWLPTLSAISHVKVWLTPLHTSCFQTLACIKRNIMEYSNTFVPVVNGKRTERKSVKEPNWLRWDEHVVHIHLPAEGSFPH